jgi:hypothetical protein
VYCRERQQFIPCNQFAFIITHRKKTGVPLTHTTARAFTFIMPKRWKPDKKSNLRFYEKVYDFTIKANADNYVVSRMLPMPSDAEELENCMTT